VIIYPAIDIRGGRCVRLVEGDYTRETVFADDPAEAARRWHAAGAEWLHVVDLDAARSGAPVNVGVLRRIRAAVPLPIQYGGGLRTLADVETMVDAGIDRAVLGSAAVHDDALVTAAVKRFGHRVAVGLDARDGLLAADGWTAQTRVSALDRALQVVALGVAHLVVTDIRRDGTLLGPNVAALAEMVAALAATHDGAAGAAGVAGAARADASTGRPDGADASTGRPDGAADDRPAAGVIASGGVGSLADLAAVAVAGVAGAIIGTALYDGRLHLPDAIAAARDARPHASPNMTGVAP